MTNLGVDNLFQNSSDARKVIKVKGEYEISFDMLKVPTLNIKKINEKLDELEELIKNEETKVQDLYRQQEECKKELEKPFEYKEKLEELLKRKNEIDTELKLDDDKPISAISEKEETEETEGNEDEDYEEFLEEEEEYDI